MDETTGTIKSSGSVITSISCGGVTTSVFPNEQDAAAYLVDLDKVCPRDGPFEMETVTVGRPKGREKAVWCSLACFDFDQNKVIQFRRCWMWSGEIKEVPKPKKGDVLPRYLWMFLDTTTEQEYAQKCRHLEKLKWAYTSDTKENVRFSA